MHIFFIFIGICEASIFYSRYNYKRLFIKNKKYLEIQNQSQLTLREKEKEIKSLYHDFNKHVLCMKRLSETGNYDELDKYINTMLREKDKLNTGIYSGNPIIDEIINDCIADKTNIKINFHGILPADINMDTYDLCTIFSNLVSNAVEACEKIVGDAQKYVDIKTTIIHNALNIVITNPYQGNTTFHQGKFYTTKVNPRYHGFGLKNVKKTVKKYNGDMNIDTECNVFTVDIVIHCLSESEREPMQKENQQKDGTANTGWGASD